MHVEATLYLRHVPAGVIGLKTSNILLVPIIEMNANYAEICKGL